MSLNRILSRAGQRRRLVVALAFALVVLVPGTASAAIETDTHGRGTAEINGPVVAIHEYSNGLATSWSASAEFDAGTHGGTTAQDVADALTLARIGPTGVTDPDPATPWWSLDWNTRECFTVDHTAGTTTVTEYPVELAWSPSGYVAAGLVQADYGDVRAIASDGTTELPMWFENASTTWVQVDTITAGSTASFCVYYGHPSATLTPPANHDEGAVFTYSTPKAVYYTVSARYDGTQNVAVASYIPANTIEMDGIAGTSSATIGDGDRTVFGGNLATTEYRVMGPIAGRGVGDGLDTLIPVSWAGTRFVVPSNREDGVTSQVLSFYAPFAAATVTIYAGTDPAAVASLPVAQSGAASWTEAADEISAGETIIIEATAPVLAHHGTTNGEDATALHPVRGVTWYGVSSTGRVGVDGEDATGTPTDVDITRSSGAASTTPLFRGEEAVLTGTPGGGGPDDAIAVSAGGSASGRAIGALSQDDGDGRETVTFLPRPELGTRYLLVTDVEYVAAACPTPTTSFTIVDGAGATSAFSCAGSGVGHGLVTANIDVTPGRAIDVRATGPAWLAYEDRATNDETNVLGIEQGRQYVWPEPSPSAAGAPEGLYPASATWESATFDTGAGTEVFGMLDLAGFAPSGVADLDVRIATSDTNPPTSFVGPTGTAVSSWSLANAPSIVDFAHDGDRYVRIKVDLSTTDRLAVTPRLDLVTVDYHLPLVTRPVGGRSTISIAGNTTATTTFLWRVRTDSSLLGGSVAGLIDVTGTDLGNQDPATIRFVNARTGLDSVQWSTAGGASGPVAFSDGAPHSIVVDHTSLGPGTSTVEFTWNLNVASGGSILVQSDLGVEIVTP